MPARSIASFLLVSLATLCVAGAINAESPALISLANSPQAQTPSTIPHVEGLHWRGKFRQRDVNQEMDDNYELLPYFENPQWLAPDSWCSAAEVVV